MLSLRFSRARWSHYEAKSSAKSKIPGRTEVGIDLISKITAVFSHRHDRSPRPVSSFLPSFLLSFPFPVLSQPGTGVRSCRCGKRRKDRGRKRGTRRSKRCLEGAIEIRIEFARIAKRAEKVSTKPRAESSLRQTFFTSSLQVRYSNRRNSRNILIVADGARISESATYQKYPHTLLPLFHIRRRYFRGKCSAETRYPRDDRERRMQKTG